jgi:heme oxygenase (biliverdin-producing, ferredoxin)
MAFVPTGTAASPFFGATVAAPAVCVSRAAQVTVPIRRVTMHGPPAGVAASTEKRPGAHKGFVEEMRFVAMRLHTKDQAPKEGGQEESALPISEWLPTHADFMQFLVDSRAMYQFLEGDLVDSAAEGDMFSKFANTGLERVEPLNTDIAYLNSLGVATPEPTKSATRYIDYLNEKSVSGRNDILLCHWYVLNFCCTQLTSHSPSQVLGS